MTVCPLCEHVQEQGDECDNCGKPLASPGAPLPQSEALPDLEPTRGLEVLELKVPPLRGLEQGREPGAPLAPLPPAPEAASDELITCPNCGVPSRIALRCRACGVPMAVPT